LPRGPSRIIALGGGAFVRKGNAVLLKAAGVPTIFLDAPVEERWRRCREQAGKVGTQRPLLGSTKRFCALYEARRNGYSKASLRIETGSRSVEEIASEIAQSLGLHNSQTAR
jgi:shikimate kinase